MGQGGRTSDPEQHLEARTNLSRLCLPHGWSSDPSEDQDHQPEQASPLNAGVQALLRMSILKGG